MKKNRMMRLASGLMVAVLLTTSMISGTFAKYVTSDSAEDSARVAKFGVEATVTGDAFKTEYAKEDAAYEVSAYSVVSSTEDKLVAPGTKGTFGGVALTGTPEVAVRVDFKETEVVINGWEVDGAFYCPLTFNINGTEVDGLSYNGAEALVEALEAAIEKGAADYAPNTDLSTIDDLNGSYTWAWSFEGDDVKDTALGDAAAEGNAATVSFAVTTTVTQID